MVDFRQASSGPTPVSSSSVNPIGIIHFVEEGRSYGDPLSRDRTR